MKPIVHVMLASVAALMVSLCQDFAQAQEYPNRPIRIVAPLPPGTAPDIVARLMAQKLTDELGQPVVVENRPGANGSIGGQLVARAPADGYTLLVPQDSLIVVNPHVYADMGWSPQKDLRPIASIASNQFYLAVHPGLPVKNFKEFVEYARKADPPLLYGSAGHGSQSQLAMEMLNEQAGIKLGHVPFRGATPAATATVSGEVHAIFSGGAIAPLMQGGKLRPLAVAGKNRTEQFPDIPSVSEFYPDFDITIWFALFAPSGTPEPVIQRLRDAIGKILAQPDTDKRLRSISAGMMPLVTSPDAFSAILKRDFEVYGAAVKALGLKAK